jgi:hypothetical protein
MCWFQGCPECLGIGVHIRCQSLVFKVVVGGVIHKRHVFHFFSGDGVDDGVRLVLLGSMVITEGDGHVGSVHSAEVVLGQVAGSEIL